MQFFKNWFIQNPFLQNVINSIKFFIVWCYCFQDWPTCSKSYGDFLSTVCQAGINKDDDKLSDIDIQNDKFEVVKKLSRSLSRGTPLIPPGSIDTELISMVVDAHFNYSASIMHLILVAGAPLLQTMGRLTILDKAWLSPASTTLEAVVITRVSNSWAAGALLLQTADSE